MLGSNRLKDIVYGWVSFLAATGPRQKPRQPKLLIVRLDEIGDFMLWHKFLEETIAAFPGYTVHFLGNKSWKLLFETLHADAVNKAVWMDKIRFKKDLRYRGGLISQVYREGYSAVVNPTFSRDRRYDDCIVQAARATQTWGMVANREAMRPYEHGYDRNLYTHLFDHPEKPVFEFYRNQLFAAFVAKRNVAVTDTRIDTGLLPVFQQQLPPEYFIVFPGSRSAARIWPAAGFVQLAGYLYERFGWKALVCGTAADKPYTDQFLQQYRYPSLDLTGATTLTDMLVLFRKAQCLLSVDTGSVHMAAAAGCRVFGIFNGSQYGRFAPYPKELAGNFHAIYPEEIKVDLQDPHIVRERYEFVIDQPYASVSGEQALQELKKMLD
ncbi:glycosyltransferase family 9 protein [Sediminibacterium soli]|uniref:glycosyltransferase family 9 protein n=1 Tax=Sediminibacterium soli TaxID=2698829 RepID=UPI00137ADC12|nr:glycosyltransferase family 9 protein [Sediminibacterium soli]NCI46616.1 glycosyltransferase family 9 protein [Sediminibacterium soli]